MQRTHAPAEEFGGQYIPEDTPPVIADAVDPATSFASGVFEEQGQPPAGGGDIDQPGKAPPEVAPDQGDTATPRAPDEVVPGGGDWDNPGATPDETQPLPSPVVPAPD